jgi:hypothetical protein
MPRTRDVSTSESCTPLVVSEFSLWHSRANQMELDVYLHSERLVHLRSNLGCITPGCASFLSLSRDTNAELPEQGHD